MLWCVVMLLPCGILCQYKAAVVEHVAQYDTGSMVPSRSKAQSIMFKNLAVYEDHVAAAASQGAQIIVFPEDGLYGIDNCQRDRMAPYLEEVPESNGTVNPCVDPAFADRPVQRTLSCMARNHSIVVVADMGDKQPCHLQPGCPEDGQWQWNTQVVFDEHGVLLQKYHKSHLFYEPQFNQPRIPDIRTFTTSFGVTFGMIICYDTMFDDPILSLTHMGVKDIVLSTWWVNTVSFPAIQYWQAMATHWGINILASGGVARPAYSYTATGIFSPKQPPHAIFQSGTVPKEQLVVATLPPVQSSSNNLVHRVVTPIDPPSTTSLIPHTGTRLMRPAVSGCAPTQIGYHAACSVVNGDPAHLVKMEPGVSGEASISCGYLTCTVHYAVGKDVTGGMLPAETYAVVAYAGTWNNDAYYEEFCMFYKCSSPNNCIRDSSPARTTFTSLKLIGTYHRATDLFPLVGGSTGIPLGSNSTHVDAKGGYLQTTEGFKGVVENFSLFGLQMNRTDVV